jgi:hypothetical protein
MCGGGGNPDTLCSIFHDLKTTLKKVHFLKKKINSAAPVKVEDLGGGVDGSFMLYPGLQFRFRVRNCTDGRAA